MKNHKCSDDCLDYHASLLARERRWGGKTAEEKRAHAMKMVAGKKAKRTTV